MVTGLGKADYKGAAELLGLAPITLRHLVSAGKIPYYKIGARVFFDVEELRSWVDAKRVEPIGGAAI